MNLLATFAVGPAVGQNWADFMLGVMQRFMGIAVDHAHRHAQHQLALTERKDGHNARTVESNGYRRGLLNGDQATEQIANLNYHNFQLKALLPGYRGSMQRAVDDVAEDVRTAITPKKPIIDALSPCGLAAATWASYAGDANVEQHRAEVDNAQPAVYKIGPNKGMPKETVQQAKKRKIHELRIQPLNELKVQAVGLGGFRRKPAANLEADEPGISAAEKAVREMNRTADAGQFLRKDALAPSLNQLAIAV